MKRYLVKKSISVWESWLQVIEEFAIRRSRRYTETSSSHRRCRRVIDEKISDRIVDLSLRIVTTVLKEVVTRRSRWYTERAWAHLLYLTSSHISIYVKNWERRRMIRTHSSLLIRVKSFNDCDRTSILTIHSTSTWHKSNQEKERIIQYITLYLFIVCVSLSSYISLLNEWQSLSERTQLSTTTTSITGAKETSSSSNRESDRNIVCKEYYLWRAEQGRCGIIKQHRHSHQGFTRASRAG